MTNSPIYGRMPESCIWEKKSLAENQTITKSKRRTKPAIG
jgi:hypothetical protein